MTLPHATEVEVIRDQEKAADKRDNISEYSEETAIETLVAKEKDHEIKFRTMSWQKTTLLLFGEYVCLAILALPWSYSVLGWATGLCVQIGVGAVTWYTSYVMWQFIMKHPEVRDICDIAALLYPGWARFAYEGTGVMLLLNNVMVIGFHVFTGAKIFNTLSDDSQCTVAFQGITAIIGILFSLPRTLKHVSFMSVFSAIGMGLSILLGLIYCGIGNNPRPVEDGGKFPTLGPVKTHGGFPDPNLTFVEGFNAVLNITFLWIGQILYPSFIAEMENPRDFPKALAALTLMEMILFLVVSVVGYNYLGQYATAPLIGAFEKPWMRKSSFAFAMIPTIIIGVIYSNVTVKVLYNRILGNSRHSHSHTVTGWGAWIGLTSFFWLLSFVLGNVIPSMGDFLSIMSAAFDSFFGFIFWATAYYWLNRGRLFATPLMCAATALNVVIFAFGLFLLGPGMYTSVQAIIDDYSGPVAKPFGCASNSL